MARCLIIPKIDFDLEWLKGNLRGDDLVLPLGLAAFVGMHSLIPNPRYVEEFVPYQEIVRRADKAWELNNAFAKTACAGETYEGYDLPAICSSYQDFFFRDILLTEALSDSLQESGMEEIVWVGNPEGGPCLYVPTESAVTKVFSYYLGNRFHVLRPPHQTVPRAGRILSRKVGNGFALLKKRIALLRRPQVRKCRIVMVFPSSEEWDRFSDTIEDLYREFGDQFQIWSLGRCTERLQNWADNQGVTVVRVPYPDWVTKDVISFFKRHWWNWQKKARKTIAEGVGCAALASQELEGYFRYHFMSVWPRVARFALILENHLKLARPDWIIGSTNPIPPQLFPYHVASKLGIRSVALPHGYVQHGDVRIKSSYLACRNAFERASFSRSFPDDDRVLYCKDAGNELSYRVDGAATLHSRDERVVVILTFNPDIPGAIMSSVDRKVFLEGFRELFVPPDDFADIRFVIKSHPRWDIAELARHREHRLATNVNILDPRLSLTELLSQSWAVVMYNYFGSAVAHAIAAEKPLLFVNTAKLFWPETEWFSFNAGEVFEEFPTFWEHLRRLKNSKDTYAGLMRKCQRFKAEWLNAPQVALSKVIGSLNGRENDVGQVPGIRRVS